MTDTNAPRGIGPRWDAEVERVDQLMCSCIVDANLTGLAKNGGTGESQDKMCIRIDAGRTIRGETGDSSTLGFRGPSC